MTYLNKIALDCDPYGNDSENITQKVKLLLASVVKIFFPKVANSMERLLRGNNCENFEFTPEVIDITEIYMKTSRFLALT